jgi:hypothetical protein
VCKGGGGVWGSGPQTDKHLPQSPFTGHFLYMTTFERFGSQKLNLSLCLVDTCVVYMLHNGTFSIASDFDVKEFSEIRDISLYSRLEKVTAIQDGLIHGEAKC